MFIYNLQSKKTEESIGGLNRGVERDKYLGVICSTLGLALRIGYLSIIRQGFEIQNKVRHCGLQVWRPE